MIVGKKRFGGIITLFRYFCLHLYHIKKKVKSVDSHNLLAKS